MTITKEQKRLKPNPERCLEVEKSAMCFPFAVLICPQRVVVALPKTWEQHPLCEAEVLMARGAVSVAMVP